MRGVTTFGYKSSPLILIDSFEAEANDLARMQPDDIESFSILKDASATALYSPRGANGIIIDYFEGRINWDREFDKHSIGLMTVGIIEEYVLNGGNGSIYATFPERNVGNSTPLFNIIHIVAAFFLYYCFRAERNVNFDYDVELLGGNEFDCKNYG